jgi:putative MATE family efflux protein
MSQPRTGAPPRRSPLRSTVLDASLWSLSWPILTSQLISVMLLLTDTLFLSRQSDIAAAAVGALFPVLTLTNALFAVSGQAGCAVAGQLMGANRHSAVPFTYGALLTLNTALGLLVGAGFLLLDQQLPQWLGLDGEARIYASIYLRWVGGTQVLTALQQALTSIVNSLGATRVSLVQAVVANVTNIAVNSLLLYGPWGAWGVQGVATASIVSKVAALLIGGWALWRHLGVQVSLPRTPGAFLDAIRPVFQIAAPSVLEPLGFETSQIAITRLIVQLGPTALAARVYTFNLCILGVLWSLSIGMGTQILLAHRIGAGMFQEAQQQLRQSLRWAALGGVAIIAVLNLLHEPLMGLFTQDPEVVALSKPLFQLGLLLELGRAANVVVGGALRSSGDARFASLVGASIMWLVAVPLCHVFGLHLGLGVLGVWLAMSCDECLRGFINYRRWASGAWQRYRLQTLGGASAPLPAQVKSAS